MTLPDQMTMPDEPRFQHEQCPGCRFLGYYGTADLWYCSQAGLPTVGARTGPGKDYISVMALAERIPAMVEAKRRAIASGLPIASTRPRPVGP